LAILSTLVDYNRRLPLPPAGDSGGFAAMLGQLRRVARPGSSIYLISDFQGALESGAREHGYQLAQHTEITALACRDPLEQELPRAGLYAVTDGEHRAELSTADRQLRQRYQRQSRERAEQLATELQRLGIPLLQLSTAEAPFPALQRYYGNTRS
ncbi:MAG: DUF58 domain-containing protein, partial [Parahaliea sp.]